jgi:ATP-binding cassette subfamily C protein CydCD
VTSPDLVASRQDAGSDESPRTGIDPWRIEEERTRNSPGFRRPDLGPLPRSALFGLGLTAALRGLGLVLIAEAVARGVAALHSGGIDPAATRLILVAGLVGALLRAGGEWAGTVIARRVATHVKRELRGSLWRRIAAGEPAGGGTAVLASDGLDALDDYYTQSVPAMIAAAVVPLLVGLRILGADWLSALVVVLTVPLIPLFMILIGKHTEQRTDEALSALTRLADHLAELARGLPVLVGLNRVAEQSAALDGIQSGYRRRTQETLRWAFLSALALELIATISVAIVAVFLGLRLLNGTIELEPALLALILAPECFAALREVGTAFHASQDGLSALERTKALLAKPFARDVRGADGPSGRTLSERGTGETRRRDLAPGGDRPENAPRAADAAGAVAPFRLVAGSSLDDRGAVTSADPGSTSGESPAIRLRELSVRYAGRGAAVIDGLDAELSGIVAVTGASGTGKSTLLAALTGSLPPDAEATGAIEGIDPDAVGWAPQAPHGFARTPREELELYGAADARAALAELGLERLADAAVAELSPGEQRRLAVARALARVDAGARLLVLDEPTAHLDRASADRVRAAVLGRAGRAVVVLASHEPETVALATRTLAVSAPAPGASSGPAAPEEAEGAILAASLPHSGGDLRTSGPPQRETSSATQNSSPATGVPEEDPDRATGTPAGALRALVRPHLGLWLAAVALGVVSTGLGLSLTAVSGWLIVRASVEEYIMYLLVAIVGVRFFGIGRSVGRYAERLVTHQAAFRVADGLRLRLWRSIASRGAGSRRLLEGGSPLDYLVTLTDELRDQLPRVVSPVAVGVLVVAGAGIATAFVAPHLTATVVTVLVAATTLACVLAIVSERGAGRGRIGARSEIVRATAALSTSADDLRGNGVSERALIRLDEAGERLAGAERRAAWAAGLGGAVVTVATTVLAFSVPLLSPQLPAEQVCVIALLSLALIEPLTGLVAAMHRVPALSELLRRLTPLLRPAPAPASGSIVPASPVRTLALDEVAVQYPGTARAAVSGVNGMAEAGGWLVLDGPSGSGKSTLLSAVMGALPLAHGAVRADDVPLTALDAGAWRERVAWCPQDAYVFDSTLRGNLLLARGRDEAPDERELRDVLGRAGLGGLLGTLPDGLDTRVGPGGSALSGGERQRLAVARALLTRAEVILLDEPTAHLDAPTAAGMMSDIRRATADRIVVLVSHRPADRHPADEVVRLP